MTHYEYTSRNVNIDTVEATLNKMDEEGWQNIGCCQNGKLFLLLFKREKVEEEKDIKEVPIRNPYPDLMTDDEYMCLRDIKLKEGLKYTHIITLWQLQKSDELRERLTDFSEFLKADWDLNERVRKYIEENKIKML